MEVQWVLVCHGCLTLLIVVSFLCGNWPIFQNTPIQRIHHFITVGAYDYFLRFAMFAFGNRGRDAVLSVEYHCCDRPNPVLQVIYLAIIGVTYYFVVKSSFIYVPGYYLSEVHRYTSFLAVGVGVLLFLLTSFSDPGTVKAENFSQYMVAYPYDNILYKEKECPTCKIPKPARSKHCSICDRCVARFDHHCGWMNNCIGEKNTRYFLAFLLWHFLLCLYGAAVLGLILAGRLKELKVIYILTVYYEIDYSFSSLAPHVIQWLVGSYNTQILLMVFLAVVSLLLAGFFGYHAHLSGKVSFIDKWDKALEKFMEHEALLQHCISEVHRYVTGSSQLPTFKWQDYKNWKRKLNEARASAAALKARISGMTGERKPPRSKWKAFFQRSPLEDVEVVVEDNIYDRGLFGNLYEIAFPLSSRSSFLGGKSD
ncbi:hypothetical protein Scep_030554 [Stephania cephalantha]|uniref:S-acyltransferase n=1 Tax=Stephania cephalantha TaxID=152367 RepID=A0AAP0E7M4_9MAGN